MLELVAIGCWAEVCGKKKEFREWQKGERELGLGMACDGLIAGAASLESHLKTTVNDTLFSQKNQTAKGLAAYGGCVLACSHPSRILPVSRPIYTDSHFRESDGQSTDDQASGRFARF